MDRDLIYIFDQQERLTHTLSHRGTDSGAVFWAASYDRTNEGASGKSNFTFQTNASGDHIDFMTAGYKFGIFDRDGRFQVFDIIAPEDTRNSRRTLKVKGRHIFHELLDAERIMDKRPTDTTLHEALTQALEHVPNWKVGDVEGDNVASTTFYRINPLKGGQTAAKEWDNELEYEVELDGGRLGDRIMHAPKRLGENRGAALEIGHNAKEIKRKVDRKNVKTAIYAWGKGEESGDGYGRRITIEDVQFSVDAGDDFNKPDGQAYIGDEQALLQHGRFVKGQLVHRFADYEDDQEEDPEALAKAAWDELQTMNTPSVTYEAKAQDLENRTDEFGERYRAHVYRLGDDVYCLDTTFTPAMRLQARIIEESDPFPFGQNDEDREFKLGNYTPKFTDNERLDQLSEIIGQQAGVWNDKVTPGDAINTDWLDGAIDALNNEIEARGGYVYMTHDNGIRIYDRPKDENPQQVLELAGGAFRIANERDRNGEFKFETFGTGDGFDARLLTAGEIMAGIIRIVGDSYFFWDSSNIVMADPKNSQKQMRIGLYDNENYGIAFTTNGGRTWDSAMGFDGLRINPTASFSDGYNPRDNEEAAFEGIGVDYGGNPPDFQRETPAYDYDMNRFENNDPVLAHGGVLLQHETENQLRGPDFSELDDEADPNPEGEDGTADGGTTDDSGTSYEEEESNDPDNSPARIESDDNIKGWTRGNWYGSTNRNRVEGISPYSDYCLRLERWNGQEDKTSSIYSWGMDVVGGEIYSLTFYVWAPRNDVCEVSIRDSTNLDHYMFEFVGTGQWERMEFYQRLPESCEIARVYLFNNKAANRIHYYSNVFFGKGYPSAYAEGKREKDVLTIGARHVFDRKKGCFEIKGVVPMNLDQTLFNMIIDENIDELDGNENRFSLRLDEDGRVTARHGQASDTIQSDAGTIRPYYPFNIAINWSDERSQWELWVDGHKVGKRRFIEPEVYPADVQINEDYVLILQDLRISKKPRNDDDLQEGSDKVYVGHATNIRRNGYSTVSDVPDNEE